MSDSHSASNLSVTRQRGRIESESESDPDDLPTGIGCGGVLGEMVPESGQQQQDAAVSACTRVFVHAKHACMKTALLSDCADAVQ